MKRDNLKNSPDYLLNVCKGLEDLRQGNKEDIRQSQIEALVGGNKVVSDLNKYLFTVATLLIPIIFSLLGVNEIRERLDQRDSVLIGASIIFLLLSLVGGFLHMISEIRFFKRWLKNTERRLKLWASISFWPSVPTADKIKDYIKEYDSIKSRTDDILSEMEEESTRIFIFSQGIFWVAGIVLIAIIAFRQLP